MNVLFICDEYPPGKNGGIGTVVQTLGRALVRKGHGVFVAGLYSHSYGEKDYEEDQGVKVWRLRYGLKLSQNPESILYKAINKLPGFIKQALNGRKAFADFISFISALIEREHIDIIEIADYNTFAMKIGFTVMWPEFKVPLVLKSHGSYTKISYDLHLTPDKKFIDADMALYKRADALSAVSHDTAMVNKKFFHLEKEIKVMYNAIEVTKHSPDQKKEIRKVIYTGGLIEQKGVHRLMEAWNLVYEKYPDAKLFLFGKGKTEPLIKLLSSKAPASVHFKGHVTRTVLFDELSKATLAIFPSYSETFGMCVIEAMNAGCPVIYTKRSCGPEIVNDTVNGLLVEPDNINEIFNAISKLFEDVKLRATLTQNGFKTVKEKFDIEKSADEHLVFYNNVIRQFKENIPNFAGIK